MSWGFATFSCLFVGVFGLFYLAEDLRTIATYQELLQKLPRDISKGFEAKKDKQDAVIVNMANEKGKANVNAVPEKQGSSFGVVYQA